MEEERRFSGRFLLRLPTGLHAALHRAAEDAGLSLNELCVRKLATIGPPVDDPGALGAVDAASRVAGPRLVGVVAFGSWARGEHGPESDVDLLVVLEEGSAVTRELYRRWDEAPVAWGGHPVEPHFVELRPADATLAGVWAEAGIDGVVLFERGLRVSRRLALVRRDIAEGRVCRRVVHGQPYWVEAA